MPNFDFSTLITDRTQADVDALVELLSTPMSDWTSEKLAEFNLAKSKGAYNYTDLNRVTACMDYLNERLTGYGYDAGYSKVEVPHGGGAGRLPSGYTELEYIESTGTQYVDTGVLPDTNTEFEVTAWMSESGVNYATLFGSRDTEQCRVYYNRGIRAIFLGSATTSIDSSVSPEQILNYKLNNSQFSVGDSVKSLTPTVNEIGYPIYIFGVNTSGSFTYGSQARIYSFKIKQDGVFARNYVPCISNSDEVGLYDLVSASFFGNAGTGTFTAGPEVNWTQQPQEPSDELDPYTWYEEDTPTLVQMNQYLANVAAIRNVLQVYATTPETPADMNGLTYQEANDIEMILVDVEVLLNLMIQTFVPCGPATCGGDYF